MIKFIRCYIRSAITRGIAYILLIISILLLDTSMLFATDTFRIGIFPRRSVATTLEMFTPLSTYLGKQLGKKVSIDVAPDMPSFWSRLEAGEYDLVHLNQYHYVRANFKMGWQAILMNEEFGKNKISGALWVLDDSEIKDVRDLRGKLIVFGGGNHAMVSSIMTKDLLLRAGLKEGSYIGMSTLQPVSSVISVFYKQADAAGVGAAIVNLPVTRKKIDVGRLRLLIKSKALAHLPWAVPATMDLEQRKKIKDSLLKLSYQSDGIRVLKKAGLTALMPANDGDYDEHRKIIKRVLKEDYERKALLPDNAEH